MKELAIRLSKSRQLLDCLCFTNLKSVCNPIQSHKVLAVPSNPKRIPLNPDIRGRVAYRLREVSEMTGIPASTLRTMARRGDLNPITSFGVWLIAADELEALLNKRLRNGTVRRSENNDNES